MTEFTTLEVVWFILIAILWLGYFILEGFDFGVGMLIRAVGKTETERRMVLHSVGPLWDGNEVWLLVAGGATFAAFPEWYATLFSGFYLALFLILAGLIIRGVSFEFWGKRDSTAWRSTWEWCLIVGSFLPALLWGVGWANIIAGVPINAEMTYTGNLFTLLNPYALLGGVMSLLLFLTHGALFLSIKTTGDVEARSRALAVKFAPVSAVVVLVFLLWTVYNQNSGPGVQWASAVVVAVAIAAAFYAMGAVKKNPLKAFGATALAIAGTFIALFIDLFPYTMVSSTADAFSMTLHESASTNYTLSVMTVVAVIFVPIVLGYQGWSYYVFRHRLSTEDFEEMKSPIDLIAEKTGGTPGNTATGGDTSGGEAPGGSPT